MNSTIVFMRECLVYVMIISLITGHYYERKFNRVIHNELDVITLKKSQKRFNLFNVIGLIALFTNAIIGFTNYWQAINYFLVFIATIMNFRLNLILKDKVKKVERVIINEINEIIITEEKNWYLIIKNDNDETYYITVDNENIYTTINHREASIMGKTEARVWLHYFEKSNQCPKVINKEDFHKLIKSNEKKVGQNEIQ